MDGIDKNKLINSDGFLNYVNNEFEKTVLHATIEELAEFAFGSIENALNEYINIKSFPNLKNTNL